MNPAILVLLLTVSWPSAVLGIVAVIAVLVMFIMSVRRA